MAEVFGTVRTLLYCVTFLFAAMMILMALPSSRLRDVVLRTAGWGVAGLSAAYVLMPLDLLPDFIPVLGWVDDGAAILAGIGGVVTALNASKGKN